jgi:acetyl-CoA C-acetyltransferase
MTSTSRIPNTVGAGAFIYDAIRTPRGRGRVDGALHTVKPVDLVCGLIDAMCLRNPSLDPGRIDDLILGCVNAVGEQGANIAIAAAMKAGLPDSICGVTLNRFCASGIEAFNTAAQKVTSGWDDLILAGGVESLSRVPGFADGGAWMIDPETNHRSMFIHQGVSADLLATLGGWTRDDVDAFAVRSQERAAAARQQGHFSRSLVPVRDANGTVLLAEDELIRPGTTVQGLAKLPAAFAQMGEAMGYDAVALQKYHWLAAIDHVHHAGNSSGIVDGASLVLVGSERAGAAMGLTPRARVVSTAVAGVDATLAMTGPAPATRKALDRAGLTMDDLDLIEINEAFASVVLHFAKEMGIGLDRINVNGGAIAMGHPFGATGAMLLGTLLDELERRGGRFGLVTICAGGGIGVSTIIERLT